jgi:hypothetical protein|tara:strand:+ start:152 stop:319 length:168 start_codon:yes stop_codon:yes gene_type:complete
MQLTSKKLPKKSNPMAREVRTPQYKQRIVKNKTIYSRKEEKKWTPTKGLLKMLTQ